MTPELEKRLADIEGTLKALGAAAKCDQYEQADILLWQAQFQRRVEAFEQTVQKQAEEIDRLRAMVDPSPAKAAA